MERSGIRDNTLRGELPTRPYSRRELFLHRYAARSAVVSIDGACRRAAGSDSCGETAIAVRIDAVVVLPDHLHTLWTLPEGDENFSGRWRAIKARFTRLLLSAVSV